MKRKKNFFGFAKKKIKPGDYGEVILPGPAGIEIDQIWLDEAISNTTTDWTYSNMNRPKAKIQSLIISTVDVEQIPPEVYFLISKRSISLHAGYKDKNEIVCQYGHSSVTNIKTLDDAINAALEQVAGVPPIIKPTDKIVKLQQVKINYNKLLLPLFFPPAMTGKINLGYCWHCDTLYWCYCA